MFASAPQQDVGKVLFAVIPDVIRDPEVFPSPPISWIPAFAGMTTERQ
jgi:hypothetical protein